MPLSAPLTKDPAVLAWFASFDGVTEFEQTREGVRGTEVASYRVVRVGEDPSLFVEIEPSLADEGQRRTRLLPFRGSKVTDGVLVAPSGKTRWRAIR